MNTGTKMRNKTSLIHLSRVIAAAFAVSCVAPAFAADDDLDTTTGGETDGVETTGAEETTGDETTGEETTTHRFGGAIHSCVVAPADGVKIMRRPGNATHDWMMRARFGPIEASAQQKGARLLAQPSPQCRVCRRDYRR